MSRNSWRNVPTVTLPSSAIPVMDLALPRFALIGLAKYRRVPVG